MPPRKRAGSKRGASASVEPESIQPAQVVAKIAESVPDLPQSPHPQISKIPSYAQFPALVLFSLLISYGLNTVAAPFTSGDLASVSAHRDQYYEIVFFLSWRAVELGVGWYNGYDTLDQGSLTLLAHLPYLFFLTSFYKIRPTTALICLTIDLVAITVPFFFFRGSRPPHLLQPPKGSVANRSLINDIQLQVLLTLLASGIYSIVVFGSFRTWAPKFFVTHFEGIKDISSLYNSQFVLLCAAFIPTGAAAKTFLFTPATAAKPDAYDLQIAAFDGEQATLRETILHNIYGYSKRVRVLGQRSLTLAAVVAVHTWLQTYLVVDGAEGFGAIGFASIWSAAALVTGLAFAWVEDVDI